MNKEIINNLDIERSLNVGSEFTVAGKSAFRNDTYIGASATVTGDLKVGGTFEAHDFVGMLKGLFATPEKLRLAYPEPRDGLTALVGDTLPANLFVARHRKWTDSGLKAGEPSLPLNAVNDKIADEIAKREKADTMLDSRLGEAELKLGVAVEMLLAEPTENRYFNLRGKQIGDTLDTIYAESTKETGFRAATVSFATTARRLLCLSGKGSDLIRNYCALDANMKIIAISEVGDYSFSRRFISLPSATRHLLLQSYDQQLRAEIYSAPQPETNDYSRTLNLKISKGICYDFGTTGNIGDRFIRENIKGNSSVPDCEIGLLEWKKGYDVTVTMNTGTPNVWGIAYIDSNDTIIGREDPFRKNLVMQKISPPAATKTIVFQTYDSGLFPMKIEVEYNLLEVLENSISTPATATNAFNPATKGHILIMGDSIMEFADENGKRVSDYIASATGREVYNCAIGGSRITKRMEITNLLKQLDEGSISSSMLAKEECYALLDIPAVARYLSSGDFRGATAAIEKLKTFADDNSRQLTDMKRADLSETGTVIIFGGTNDYASGISADEKGDSATKSLYGALNETAALLLSNYPHLRILVCTPIPRMKDPSDPSTFSDTYIREGAVSSLPAIAGAVAQAAGWLHLPVVDLYNTLGWNRYNYASKCISSDGSHPRRGWQEIAAAIIRYL